MGCWESVCVVFSHPSAPVLMPAAGSRLLLGLCLPLLQRRLWWQLRTLTDHRGMVCDGRGQGKGEEVPHDDLSNLLPPLPSASSLRSSLPLPMLLTSRRLWLQLAFRCRRADDRAVDAVWL